MPPAELIDALKAKDHARVKALLAAGAPVNARDKHGYTPLHIAAASGNLECVALLLAKGADRDARAPDGMTPADFARKNEFPDVAARLMSPEGQAGAR